MNEDYRRPMATYRLQFNHDFRLNDAQALVPYFSRLGVTHVYASPILRARQVSTHGYDVVDPKTINPSLGGKTDLYSLVNDLRNFGLGMILDIVPNHMAASIENPYWRDVLTYGPSSPFAGWFDIDWRMPDPHVWGRVLVPVLGEPRGRVLDRDQIRIVWSDGRFLVQYFQNVFPIDPATVPMICGFGLDDLKERLQEEPHTLERILEILARLKSLPKLVARRRRGVDIDRDETEQWLAQFAQVVVQSVRIQQWAEETAERFGEGEGGRHRLRKLLESQPYQLVYWRAAARTLNYRRFFDINELIAIRQEDPRVFEETHSAILRWVDEGLIDGLRIDHIDGLCEPRAYLERLAEALSNAGKSHRPLPVFVEKILAPEEELPCGWPVAGTTGYDFLNQVEAALISPKGYAEIEHAYRRLLRRSDSYESLATWGKRRVLRDVLSPHVGRLADTLYRLFEISRRMLSITPRDETATAPAAEFARAAEPGHAGTATAGGHEPPAGLVKHAEPTKRDFEDAIVEVITAFPVYRTYVDSHHNTLNDADRRYIETALAQAAREGRAPHEAIEFLGEVLLLEDKYGLPDHELRERVHFIRRFQQLSGPAAAKGIEDTALYAYVPLVSLNEVGGEPALPDDPVSRLHQANLERETTWPQAMLAATTHDTKRTADVRARLDVLSELPRLWTGQVRRWRRMNKGLGEQVDGKHAPDAATEYLFYQTVVGLWPAPAPNLAHVLPEEEVLQDLRVRIQEYMLKAAREAKTHTSWTQQKRPYEECLVKFVGNLLRPESGGLAFLTDVQRLVARIARPGFWNSLSRTLVQFTAPGTPDLYQGDELWNFALVDPDNRRPVDFESRQRLLDEVITGMEGPEETRRQLVRDLVAAPEDGRIKVHLIHRALVARRENPQLFGEGQYIPLSVDGPAKHHLIAFARMGGPRDAAPSSTPLDRAHPAAIVVAPRLTAELVSNPADAPLGSAAWSDTVIQLPYQLRSRHWTCALTRESVRPAPDGSLLAAEVLQTFPAALLLSESRSAQHLP